MSHTLLVGFVFAVAACNTTKGNDGGGGGTPDAAADPGPGPGGSPVIPRTGTWYYADANQVQNTCGYNVGNSAGDFAIDQASLTMFHVDPDDGTDPFWCELASGSFNCPDRAAKTEDLHPSFDAVIVMHASATGTFSTELRASGQQSATVTCTGAGCASLGTWPCSFKVDYDIAAR